MEYNLAAHLIDEVIQNRSTKLDLSNCGLFEIPSKVTELYWLEELIIGSERYFDLEKKEYVFSHNSGRANHLSILPMGLSELQHLKKLVITNKEDVPLFIKNIEAIYALESLETLYLNHVWVENIDFLANLHRLRVLSLSKGGIRSITPLSHLPNLELLRISHNRIEDIWPLAGLKNLRELHFSDNHVEDLSSVGELVGLQELYCASNEIKDLTALESLKQLRILNIDTNQVSEIKPLIKLPELKKFSCLKCPIKDCPADIYEAGDPIQLKSYFKAKAQQSFIAPPHLHKSRHTNNDTSLNQQKASDTFKKRDVKLIILGNSNVGKTNLVNFLQSQQFKEERNTTHGLEVTRWLPDEEHFPELKDIAVSIWDFGGQEYYHGAYRLFLSANAVYLVLWCKESNINGKRKAPLSHLNKKEVELENFELTYWLDTVRHYSKGTSEGALIVVQNKTDDPYTDKVRIDQDLHQTYVIQDSFHISLWKGSTKENRRQFNTLQHFLQELGSLIARNADSTTIPVHWQQLRDEILSLKESSTQKSPFRDALQDNLWISLDEFEKACNQLCEEILSSPITQDEMHTLPRWLDRGGIVVYFPDIPALQDRIFLRPDLLAQNIYKVLDQQVHKKGGEFSAADIGLKGEMKQVFVQIAKHLELIFDHPHPKKNQKGLYLAPQYLPDNHPIEDLFKIASKDAWEDGFWVKVPLFYYKKILHGLLIAYASDKSIECRYFWKHGIMFIKDELRVLIKGLYPEEDEREGVILVGVERGSEKQLALQKEIFSTVLDIISGKKTLRMESMGSTKETFKSQTSLEVSKVSIQVSYDRVNYVDYWALLKNQNEVKVRDVDDESWVVTKHFAALLPSTPPEAKRVFLSYSHQNTYWLGRLRTHLAGLRRAKEVETWDDKEILPGDLWDNSIKKKLEEADVFILLLSADFIASDYIWEQELTTAFRSFKDRKAIVIPILLEPLDLGGLPQVATDDQSKSFKINDFEIVPKNEKGHLQAVSLWQNQEEALAKVAEAIRAAIRV